MEDCRRDNGTLVVYPGTHKGVFEEHSYPDWGGVNKAYFGVTKMPPEDAPKVHLQMKSGDVVLFHPLLLHGSGENKSDQTRKSICCHFADASCNYIDIKGTFHETMANEVMSYA